MKARRAISAPLNEFHTELRRLKALDRDNQRRLTSAPARPPAGTIPKKQLNLLCEAVFLQAFRAYESFVQDVFLLYCLEKPTLGGRKPKSYVKPTSFEHAYHLIKSSMYFVDWTAPETIIKRAELYLEEGFVIKQIYTAKMVVLRDLKILRNHIAHASVESHDAYRRLLRRYLGTLPVREPSVGEFLLLRKPTASTSYYLTEFIDDLQQLSIDLTWIIHESGGTDGSAVAAVASDGGAGDASIGGLRVAGTGSGGARCPAV